MVRGKTTWEFSPPSTSPEGKFNNTFTLATGPVKQQVMSLVVLANHCWSECLIPVVVQMDTPEVFTIERRVAS